MFFPSTVRNAPAMHSAVALGVAAALASFNFAAPAWAADVASGETLEPIVVTATRTVSSWKTAPVGATIITAQQIEHSGVSDANEAIRKLAGVASRTDLTNGRERTLDLRGFGATADSNMVVLVNGIRISENEQAAARLTAIPIQLIDRIEVVRGGSSVLWGEGASAGVINVILKDSAKAGAHARVLASVESFNGREYSADGSWGGEQLSVDASVKRLRSDGYRQNSAYAQDLGSVGLQWANHGLHASARIQQDEQKAGLPGPLSFAEFAANPRQAKNLTSWFHTSGTNYSGNVGADAGDLGLDLDFGSRDRRTDFYSVSGGLWTRKTRQTEMTPRVTYDVNVAGITTRSQVGATFQNWRLLSAGSSDAQSNHGVFAHTDWTLPTQTRLVAGARQEHIDKQSAMYAYSDRLNAHELGLSQTVVKSVDVYGRLARSYRVPNADENGYTPTFLPLLPQKNRDAEIGVKWAEQGRSATVRWFKQKTVNEIAYDPMAGTYGGNINLEPTRRQGVELEGRAQIANNLELSGTWQHLTAKQTSGVNAGKEATLVAPTTAVIRATYQVTDAQSVSVGMQYMAPMRFGNDQDNACTNRIPSMRPIDATYRWSDQLWTVVLTGSNLADHKSYAYAYSCTAGYVYPEAGRTLKLSASRSF